MLTIADRDRDQKRQRLPGRSEGERETTADLRLNEPSVMNPLLTNSNSHGNSGWCATAKYCLISFFPCSRPVMLA